MSLCCCLYYLTNPPDVASVFVILAKEGFSDIICSARKAEMANRAKHKDVTFHVGDVIRVHHRIREGEKSRIQLFDGIVIAIKAHADTTFMVRRIASAGIGVEKIFPLDAPTVEKIEVKRRSSVRRSKLYYLRDRVGKRAIKVRAKKIKVQLKKKPSKKPKARVKAEK